MQKYDPVKQEPKILNYWKTQKIKEKQLKKNTNGNKFYFLDGPPYTSGHIHLGTAWNKSLKDMVTRYKRMKGFDVWDRAGYDMHGLPTEGKVQAKMGMKTKEEIVKYGLSKFIHECRTWAVTNLKQMNKDFQRLGVWLDFDNAYQTIDNEYIEGTWWLVKKAHEKKRLYEGQMVMTWCGSCQTSLAKHELEYKNVTDKSLYVKFQLAHKPKEYLIIWTTTAWTIAFNLGVMVNPDVTYIRAKVGEEVWIIAEDLAEKVIKKQAGKNYTLLERIKGKNLEGIKYLHPMADVLKHHHTKLAEKSTKLFSVVLSPEFVNTEYGTGLVHMAPGSGPEDYEVGHRLGIPPFNQVDQTGYYDSTMGPFSKLHVKEHNEVFIEDLEKRGNIVAIEEYGHEYPHCWRCKNPVIYRTTTQWFFRIEDLIPKMRKLNNEKITWIPEWAGTNQFDSWLENLRDNGITRQRFWGSPLPVWKCSSCSRYVVVESRNELKSLNASHIPDDLHKPWIDDVTIPCKCGETMLRNPDIMDVWIDAGVDSWASLGYPADDTLYKKLFPADFITEAKDQIRGWFNLLFVASMLAMEDISFKVCYMHGYINDTLGRKMSKSLGNIISPDEVTQKYGADTFRYYVLGAASPGVDLNYNFEDIELKRRNLSILWNLHIFVMDLAENMQSNPVKLKPTLLRYAGHEEKYILSKLNSTIRTVNDKMEKYHLNEIPWLLEELYMELSRTYIQMVREKISSGDDNDKQVVLFTVYHVFEKILILMAPIVPFITEIMYLNFKKKFGLKTDSIHLHAWPTEDSSLIDDRLQQNIETAKNIIQAAFAAREKAQIGVRWPLKELIIQTQDSNVQKSIKLLEDLIKNQTNVKNVRVTVKFDKEELEILPNFKTMGPEFGKESQALAKIITEKSSSELNSLYENGKLILKLDNTKYVLNDTHLIFNRNVPKEYTSGEFSQGIVYLNTLSDNTLQAEGYVREIIRRIQSYRKEAGLRKNQMIPLTIFCENELFNYLLPYSKLIENRTGSSKLLITNQKQADKYKHEHDDNIKGLKFKVMFMHK